MTDTAADEQTDSSTERGFAELGLAEPLVQAVSELGYEEPTPIQREAIPVLLSGADLLGLAATGTGKTAAFALPLLQGMQGTGDARGPLALILVPTRELAMQVAEAVHRYGRAMRVRVLPVYGGAAMGVQLRALQRGVDVVVATPGRALDHLRRGTLRLESVSHVVLDEADEMLDMGFQEDLEAILSDVPDARQMALFSATFPRRLQSIVSQYLDDPVRVAVEREEREPGDVPRVRQVAYLVRRVDKRAALARVLDMEGPTAALVFCRTRLEVDELADSLDSRGYRAEPLHGGLSQMQRDRVMQKLRSKSADLIVATDVAARGIDIGHLSHVINFDMPPSPDQYVHRIGRTGRAGREGVAITLLEPRERRHLRGIERATGQRLKIESVPTVADLKARRMDLVCAQVREAALSGGLEPYRSALDTMADDLDVFDIAAAAMKALQQASWSEDEEEIADLSRGRPERDRQYGRGRSGDRGPRPHGGPAGGQHGGPRGPQPNWTRLFVGLGRHAGLRPGDLFAAIVNETGLPRGAVGAIRIAERYAHVEVPAEEADRVIQALRRTTFRGRKPVIDRDRGGRR